MMKGGGGGLIRKSSRVCNFGFCWHNMTLSYNLKLLRHREFTFNTGNRRLDRRDSECLQLKTGFRLRNVCFTIHVDVSFEKLSL
jgi:hypothetical protein